MDRLRTVLVTVGITVSYTLVVALAVSACTSCATGHVMGDGTMYGAAIGEGAQVSWTISTPTGEAGIIAAAPVATRTVTIKGGPILPSIIDILGSALGGAAKFVMSMWGAP